MGVEMRVKAAVCSVAMFVASSAFGSEGVSVKSCSSFFNGSAGSGVAYRHHILNDDYHMSVVVPQGETGWSGVADDAPFHGFAVFPVGTRSSCIILVVGWRVDDDEKPSRPPGSTDAKIRGTQAWSEQREGTIEHQNMMNEIVSFSAPVRTTFADGQVIMVASADEAPKVRKIYQRVLESLSFK
jgi:hypothetical protein